MRDVDTDIAHMVRLVEGFLSAGFADKAEKYADTAVELMDSRRRYCRAAYWGVDADTYQAEIEREHGQYGLAASTVDDGAVRIVPHEPIDQSLGRGLAGPVPPPVDTEETSGWATEPIYDYKSREGYGMTESEAREPTTLARSRSVQARRDFEANKKNEGRGLAAASVSDAGEPGESTPEPVEVPDAEANAPLEISPAELREDAKRVASPWHWGHLRKSETEDA